MKIIAALVFVIVSATAYLEDLDEQTYYIQSAVTKNYLYVDPILESPNDTGAPGNVSMLETANTMPTPRPNSLFLVVKNNAIGPYYNIINLGTNSTLFATESPISYELGGPAYKVMALKNATLLNAPEAIWNIRTFLNDTYILNVHFGSYLYTSTVVNSSAVMRGASSLPLLLRSEAAGRALGTQWLIVRSDASVGAEIEVEGQKDRKYIEKMAEGRAAKETEKGLEEQVENQLREIEEKVDTKEDKQFDNEEVVVKEKEVKTDGEQFGFKKAVEEEKVEQTEVEPRVGEKKEAPQKNDQVEMVPSVKIEKIDLNVNEQGGAMSDAGEEKLKNEDVQKEMLPWMTPMEPWLREEKLKHNEDEQAQTERGEKVEENVDGLEGKQVQMPPAEEEVKVNSMRDEKLERSAMLGWETRIRADPPKGKPATVDPNDPDFKAFALMFNCHLTTTRSPFTTTKFSVFWPHPYPDSPYARPGEK